MPEPIVYSYDTLEVIRPTAPGIVKWAGEAGEKGWFIVADITVNDVPVDFTGQTLTAIVRESRSRSSDLIATFTVTTPELGRVRFELDLTGIPAGEYFFDFKAASDTIIRYWLEGSFTVNGHVS